MAWFRNHYRCERCGRTWIDEWSCMCDDDCPHCGARHMSPVASDDLSEIVEEISDGFAVLRSSDWCEDSPDYAVLGTFPTREAAEAWRRS